MSDRYLPPNDDSGVQELSGGERLRAAGRPERGATGSIAPRSSPDEHPLESLDDKTIEEVCRIAFDTIERMRKDMPLRHRIRLLPTSILARRAVRKLERRG